MCCNIAIDPKHSLHQLHQAVMFTTFSLSLKAVECEEWDPLVPNAESSVDQFGSVSIHSGFLSDLICHTFCCLEDCMKVILLEQFWATEDQYIVMYSSAY